MNGTFVVVLAGLLAVTGAGCRAWHRAHPGPPRHKMPVGLEDVASCARYGASWKYPYASPPTPYYDYANKRWRNHLPLTAALGVSVFPSPTGSSPAARPQKTPTTIVDPPYD